MKKTGRPGVGEIAFRWRSFLPLLAAVGLMLGLFEKQAEPANSIRLWIGSGLALAGLGLTLRLYGVGHAPAGTSGRHRRQHAALLNTFGIYSIVRHPLYLGNVLVWIGVSLTSGWPVGAAASSVAAAVMFGAIVRHEDAYLARRFGSDFEEWAAVTPAFVPRPGLWRTARRPFRWALAVASEYSTLHSIGLLALLFAAVRRWVGEGALPGPGWWALLSANSVLYLAIRAWRSRTRSSR
ncbi:MAG: methyltransferase [Acidobacteria bacterium]|nr:methyltransferase [Acidobacteriota bacterium]